MYRQIYFGLIIFVVILFAVSVWAIRYRRVNSINSDHDNYEKTTRKGATCRTINDYLDNSRFKQIRKILISIAIASVIVFSLFIVFILFKRFGHSEGPSVKPLLKNTAVDSVAFPSAPDVKLSSEPLETVSGKSTRFSPFVGVSSSSQNDNVVPLPFSGGKKTSVASSVYGNIKIPNVAFSRVSDSL